MNVPTFFDAKTTAWYRLQTWPIWDTRYVDMIVGNRKSLDGKSDLMQGYINCALEACEALEKDPDMAADLLVEFLQDAGMETSKENCVADLNRVNWLTKDEWKGRELGNFAKELGEFYVEPGTAGSKCNRKIQHQCNY